MQQKSDGAMIESAYLVTDQTYSPETEVLFCCSRTNLDSEREARLKTLVQGSLDWDVLLQAAQRHRLVPLCHWHLSRVAPQSVPEEVLAWLGEQFNVNGKRNFFLAGELIALLRLFEKHGVSAIPWKGPALAVAAYANLSLRQFGDLDIFVHRHDVSKVSELLASRGYQKEYWHTPRQEESALENQCEHAFIDHAKRVMVEIHWRVTPKAFSFQFDSDRLWDRLSPLPLAGQTVPDILPEELLLLLCVHGSKHCWPCLSHVCDVSELILVNPNLEWDRVSALARSSGSERMLLLGLALARDLLDTDIPTALEARARHDARVAALKRQCETWLSAENKSIPAFWGTIQFHLKAKERLSDRIRYCVGQIPPTAGDWSSLRLPDSLFPLYYVYRPLRLAYRHATSVF